MDRPRLFPQTATQRLIVREFTAQDLPSLLRFVDDPTQLSYMMFSLASRDEAERFLELALGTQLEENRVEWHLAVEAITGEGPRFIGCVDIMGELDNPHEAELGYFFLRGAWGNGYAVEASRVAIDFAFRELGLHRVWGKCHADNKGSARVMEKLGMSLEGIMREHYWMRDHWRSSCLYAVLDREWPQA